MIQTKSIWHNIFASFFPIECLGCNEPDIWLCENCQNNFKIRSADEQPHIRYQDYLDKIWVTSYFSDPILKKCITELKYHYREELAKPLGNLMNLFIKKNHLLKSLSGYIIIPLPLHHRRYLERGFNQSELLTRQLSSILDVSIVKNVLLRKKYTKHQTVLDHLKRKNNIENAFEIINNKKINFQKILLVDDVVTTGASLNEAAKILRLAGARKVVGLVLAKN